MAVNPESMVERLAGLPALAHVPRKQLVWLVEHGEYHRVKDGTSIRSDSSDASGLGLYLLVSGRFSVRVDQDGVVREVREVTPGRFTGYLPYSRMISARGYVVADGPVEFLLIQQDDIEEMTRACYDVTALCVHEMLDRVRVFKSDDKHQEKMAALGRLAAGLAHELNNPTSAVARAAGELDASRVDVAAASRALGAAGLDRDAMRALESLEDAARRPASGPLSPIDRAELEDRVMEWLYDHGLDPDLGNAMAGSVTVADLDAAASSLDAEQLPVVLRYVAANTAARGLTADISSAASRIHSLVAAVKKHTHMDRAQAVESIPVDEHLADTVALMTSRASLRGVSLELGIEADLPTVAGSVADLNQVWMHLIDNAIDAATESVRICVDAGRDRDTVHVRVIDDGPGIPAEDQERVFEPFFTTKDVGQGRGLGLDIVRTVVRNHRGTVDVSSSPGHTEFRVTLPAAGTTA